jgi:hypothetical protein
MYSLKKYEIFFKKCFLWFFKVWWVQKIQGVTWPKDAFAPLSRIPNQVEPIGVPDHTTDVHLFTL